MGGLSGGAMSSQLVVPGATEEARGKRVPAEVRRERGSGWE
jgi:hypothetical protein